MTTVRYQLTNALNQDALELKKQFFSNPKNMNIDDYKRLIALGADEDADFKAVATEKLLKKAQQTLVPNTVDESTIRIQGDKLSISMMTDDSTSRRGGDAYRELSAGQVKRAILVNLSGNTYQTHPNNGDGKQFLEIQDIWGARSQISTPADFEQIAKADGDASKISDVEAINALLDSSLGKNYVAAPVAEPSFFQQFKNFLGL